MWLLRASTQPSGELPFVGLFWVWGPLPLFLGPSIHPSFRELGWVAERNLSIKCAVAAASRGQRAGLTWLRSVYARRN